MALKALCLDGLEYLKEVLDVKLALKVDKVEGKGLSTNDFTDADKAKLDKIDPSVVGTPINPISKSEIDKIFGVGFYKEG